MALKPGFKFVCAFSFSELQPSKAESPKEVTCDKSTSPSLLHWLKAWISIVLTCDKSTVVRLPQP